MSIFSKEIMPAAAAYYQILERPDLSFEECLEEIDKESGVIKNESYWRGYVNAAYKACALYNLSKNKDETESSIKTNRLRDFLKWLSKESKKCGLCGNVYIKYDRKSSPFRLHYRYLKNGVIIKNKNSLGNYSSLDEILHLYTYKICDDIVNYEIILKKGDKNGK